LTFPSPTYILPPPKERGRIKEGEGIPFILKDIVKQCGETVQL